MLIFLGSFNGTPRLKDVIEEAERESKILANEINQWLLQESGSFLKEDEQMHLRSRRSIDEDGEDVRTDTNLLSEVGQLIVRREVKDKDKSDKKDHKKKSGVPVIKKMEKKVNSVPVNKRHDQKAKKKDSFHLVKKQGSDMRADKHHTKTDKHKAKTDEISKANLVKELIGAKTRDAGVPDKEYRELIEFIASGVQPTIETSSKKSDIARPSAKAQGERKKLTKKHKRVLAALAKMAPDALRKYFHKKGLDKYWKVMDNIRKMNAMKQKGMEKLKAHEDAKSAKQVKPKAAPKKNKHPERDVLLTKQIKSHQKNSKQEISHQKIVKDEASEKSHEPDGLLKKQIKFHQKDSKKAVSQQKMVKDEAKGKPHKPDILQSSSKQKVEVVVVKPAKETHQKTMNQASHHEKKEGQKITVEQHLKEISQTHKVGKKNLFKMIKSKDGVKVAKSSQTANVAASHVKASAASKTHEKLTALEVKPGMKGLEAVATKKTSSPKKVNDKAKDSNAAVHGSKVMKESTSRVKIPASAIQRAKLVKPVQVVENKDSSSYQIKTSQSKAPGKQEASQHQVKAMANNLPNKNKVVKENSKESPKANAVTAHHAIKTMHGQQPEVKQTKKEDESSRANQENLGSSKIDFLKEKIRKTNNLKFKVAQALLAHCETQNRLRQVFDDVNSSLKKAAALAKAIGEKFGIKQSDIDKMTSEHTEGAVEQFLNQLF